jgi:hypothetical protein
MTFDLEGVETQGEGAAVGGEAHAVRFDTCEARAIEPLA